MKLQTSVAIRPWRRARGPAVLAAVSTVVALLAGCGQKGALVLPAPSSNAASAPASK